MLSQILPNIECAIGHKCAREANESAKCAHCAVGYLFIAHEPTSLKCGHHICKECSDKSKSGSLKCKLCSNAIECLGLVNQSSAALVAVFTKDLANELKEKFKMALDLYEGNFESFLLI